MITWKLWRAINHPPRRNPLYFRSYTTAEQPAPWYVLSKASVGSFFILPIIAVSVFILFIPIIAFTAAFYGIGWAVGISNMIARERGTDRYDLYSLTPPGALGITWAIAAGYLYFQRTFRNINQPGNLWLRIIVVAVMLTGFDTLLLLAMTANDTEIYPFAVLVLIGLHFITLVASMYIDHIQSITVSVLTGMLATTYTPERSGAQLIALALYLSVQMTTYLVSLIIGFTVLPMLFNLLGLRGVLPEAILLILRLILFAGLRAALMIALWRVLLTRLNAQPSEMGIAA